MRPFCPCRSSPGQCGAKVAGQSPPCCDVGRHAGSRRPSAWKRDQTAARQEALTIRAHAASVTRPDREHQHQYLAACNRSCHALKLADNTMSGAMPRLCWPCSPVEDGPTRASPYGGADALVDTLATVTHPCLGKDRAE